MNDTVINNNYCTIIELYFRDLFVISGMGSKTVTIKESKLTPPATDKPEYFTIGAFVMHIRQDNFCYKACPQPDCNKKVTFL